MWKKLIGFIILTFSVFLIFFLSNKIYSFLNEAVDIAGPVSEKKSSKEANLIEKQKAEEKFKKRNIFNILLLGIDRRSKKEESFRTDIMILTTFNTQSKKILFTSIPRDLWVGSGKINGLYTLYGYDSLRRGVEELSGQTVDAYIRVDFEDLVWLVDSLGGLEITLDRAFSDYEYPNDATKTYMAISFPEGKQVISGRQALQLSRSRHGNNGEGSDFMRMQRQHKILKSLPDAISSPKSIFNPFVIEKFFEAVLTQGFVTDLTLEDSKVLWDYYKYKNEYTTDSFYLDYEYLYSPPLPNEYGAWVLIPKNKDFTAIHNVIKEKVGIITP